MNHSIAELLEIYRKADLKSDQRVTELLELSARFCGVRCASSILVGEPNLIVKAAFGHSYELVPRHEAFCSRVLDTGMPYHFEDASQIEDYKDHQWVHGAASIRSYLGVPLVGFSGELMGTVCVFDVEPKPFKAEMVEFLKVVAELIRARILMTLDQERLDERWQGLQRFSNLIHLGRLSSELLHELSNPLAIIHARAIVMEALSSEGSLDPAMLAKSIDSIRRASQRMLEVLNGVRAHAHTGSAQDKEDALVSEIIEDAVFFCAGSFLSRGIKASVDPVPPGLKVKGGRLKVSQVLVNLLMNAADAVAGSNEPWVKLIPTFENRSCFLRVMDSGLGIAQDAQMRLFEAFYTTKGIGKGTGLGLGICKKILEEFGGDIRYELYEGHTSFVVQLPLAD